MPTAIAISPDSRLVAVGMMDGTLLVFDVSTREVVKRWIESGIYASRIDYIVFSQNGLQLLLGYGEVRVNVCEFYLSLSHNPSLGDEGFKNFSGQMVTTQCPNSIDSSILTILLGCVEWSWIRP